ncbi:hypothetical protein M758_UG217300 [Ceratodon purpureus]|nr:hypothetical protein M758_UG217300 [Ceratodon purpureus]
MIDRQPCARTNGVTSSRSTRKPRFRTEGRLKLHATRTWRNFLVTGPSRLHIVALLSQMAHRYHPKVRSAYPSASLLFTGHSLGGGLAILVSAALSTDPGYPVIAFGSAGTRTALQVRNLNLSAEHQRRIVTIADQ